MRNKKKLLLFIVLMSLMILMFCLPTMAADLTEAEVEKAVAKHGKEAVTGNVFVWFLCAIAFLKVSQKIDSFMASIGVNVGNTGGNMMAELLIAGRGITHSLRPHGTGGGYRKQASPGSTAVQSSFLSGGLAGAVGRQVERSAIDTVTGYSENSTIGNSLYRSSLSKGGDFANNVISKIAQGNYGQVGSIKGADAEKAFTSYMGMKAENNAPLPTYSNVEIGGGRITGIETTDNGSKEFAMYHSDQYMAPAKGTFDTVQSVDGSTWYRQYAQDTVSKTPYDNGNGTVAYHESIVQKLPPTPPRKDKI